MNIEGYVVRSKFDITLLDAEARYGDPFAGWQYAHCAFVICVHNGVTAVPIDSLKELGFCSPVGSDGAVVLQMLVGDIGHRADIKLNVVQTMQIEPMRCGFEYNPLHSRIDHSPQRTLNFERFRGSLAGLVIDRFIADLD